MKKLFVSIITALAALSTLAQTFEVGLTWQPNPEPDVKGYTLYQGTQPGKYDVKTDVGLMTVVHVRGLEPATTYYFVVTARNEMFESDKSNEVEFKTPGGAPVTEITGWKVTRTPTTTTVTWDKPPADQWVTHWRVLWQKEGAIVAGDTTVTEPKFELATDTTSKYMFFIEAYGAAGKGPTKMISVPAIPAAPTGLEVDESTLKLTYPRSTDP